MLKKRKLCGDMQNWDPLLQFDDGSVQSTTETLLMPRESRSGKQHFLRQDLSLRGMVVAEHEHQRKMFGALQIHLQEALGNPFVRHHVSLLSQNSVHNVLHKRLKLCAYKLQILHEVKPDDEPKHTTFAADILQHTKIDNFLAKVLFFR
jgi:hypothetical protein